MRKVNKGEPIQLPKTMADGWNADRIRKLAESGERLPIRMMNDFAIKRVLHNKKALKGLLSSLLDIPVNEIRSLEFADSVLSGEYAEEHGGILDIRIIMNNDKRINVEMQIRFFAGWEERSLFYLSRMFVEGFEKGGDYKTIEACIHISILGYSLSETEGFYSIIELRNRKTGRLYSDKFSLRVLYLNKVDDATEEEKQTDVYRWAKMISATDWEVLEEMAAQDEYRSAALEELRKINADKELRYLYLRQEMAESDRVTMRNTDIQLGREEGIRAMVCENLEEHIPESRIIEKLQKYFSLDYDTAVNYLDKFKKQ